MGSGERGSTAAPKEKSDYGWLIRFGAGKYAMHFARCSLAGAKFIAGSVEMAKNSIGEGAVTFLVHSPRRL
jgi:hypothetical protein